MCTVCTESAEFKQPVSVPLSYETHGGEDVAVYATGPMSHLFTGVNEQHYLAHAMAYALCVGSAKSDCTRSGRLITDAAHPTAATPAVLLTTCIVLIHSVISRR